MNAKQIKNEREIKSVKNSAIKSKKNAKSTNALKEILARVSPVEQAKVDATMMMSARIQDAMMAKGWNNKHLLLAMGKKHASVVSKWLSGTHNFTIETLVELESALEVPLLDLGEARNGLNVRYAVGAANAVFVGESSVPYSVEFSDNNATKSEFVIVGIELLELCIHATPSPLQKNEAYNFDLRLEHKPSTQTNEWRVDCRVMVHRAQQNAGTKNAKKIPLGSLCVGVTFANSKQTNLKNRLEELNNIVLNTTRGIMWAHFSGTHLRSAVLPGVQITTAKSTKP